MKKMIKWEGHEGNLKVSVSGFDVIECQKCSFVHIVPIPSEEELQEFYRDKFYSSHRPDYIKNHTKDNKWWNQIFNERIDLFEANIKSTSRRILDIGSGPGFFLKYFKERGWDVLGIEPSTRAAELSRKLDLKVINEVFNSDSINKIGPFDVIYSNQTFEHLPKPLESLELIHNLLSKNGLFFISVANDFNPIQDILHRKMGFNPWWISAPEHINYFNIGSLKSTVSSASFKILDVTTTFPIDLFLLMGENYIGNGRKGKKSHQMRKTLEFNLHQSGNSEFKKVLYKSFSELNIGREIELLAQKR